MDLSSLIKELILKHNCVIIPDFGGFVATISSTKIDFEKGFMLPPSKQVLFNKNLINNDGLLIHELASKNSITYDQSSTFINEEVAKWNETLKNGNKVEIENLGSFYLNNENNLIFEQDRFFNLLMQSFGLSTVTFLAESNTIKEELKAESKVITFNPIKIVHESINENNNQESKLIELPNRTVKVKKIVKYIAAACILPIAFYSVWIPIKTDVLNSGIVFSSDFNPFNPIKETLYTLEKKSFIFDKIPHFETIDEQITKLPSTVYTFSYEFSEDLFIPVKIKEKNTNTSISLKEKTTLNNLGQFKLIVGSFSQQKNAKNLIDELKTKGFNAFILSENEMFRVCAATTSSKEDSEEIIKKLAELNLSAWVLKN
jgi:hypothetical protein